MLYYLKNRDNPAEAIERADAREALAIAQERNKKDRSANWKVYTKRGDLVTRWIVHARETITY